MTAVGCATGLLLTVARAELIRATLDVEIVAQVASLSQYQRLEAVFRGAIGERKPKGIVVAGAPL